MIYEEKKNTCFGVPADGPCCVRSKSSRALLQGQRPETDGTAVAELERLAGNLGSLQTSRKATVEQLRDLLAEGKLPIVYLDRAIFDIWLAFLPCLCLPLAQLYFNRDPAVIHTVVRHARSTVQVCRRTTNPRNTRHKAGDGKWHCSVISLSVRPS